MTRPPRTWTHPRRWSPAARRAASVALALAAAAAFPGPVPSAWAQASAGDLLADARFRQAYMAALGPKAKERWLATLANSALVRTETIAGERFQVVTPCKPHDCAEHNLLLLYAPASGALYGHLHERGRVTVLGRPAADLQAQMQTLWTREFRQR